MSDVLSMLERELENWESLGVKVSGKQLISKWKITNENAKNY